MAAAPKFNNLITTHYLVLVLFLFLINNCICSASGNGQMPILDLNSVKPSEFDPTVKRVCEGKINECSSSTVMSSIGIEGEEEEMDSESNKRMLFMQRRYISYDTLKRDLVPCLTPGASYYNCRSPDPANSYNRGCEMITRCRGGG